MDQWPGYAAERMALVRFLAERRVPNPVVLTGDIHSNWVNDLRVDDRKAETPVVATEFVGTSITSGGNGTARAPKASTACWPRTRASGSTTASEATSDAPSRPGAWRSDYVVVEDIRSPADRRGRGVRSSSRRASPG